MTAEQTRQTRPHTEEIEAFIRIITERMEDEGFDFEVMREVIEEAVAAGLPWEAAVTIEDA